MERQEADFQVLNVGTGIRTTLRDLARGLTERLAPGNHTEPVVLGTFREGDIRHCYADITRIRALLGYEPEVRLEQGYEDLVAWARIQKPSDGFDRASEELVSRGLVSRR
jgi:dTDP-L-rhamnose 4-epimerase